VTSQPTDASDCNTGSDQTPMDSTTNTTTTTTTTITNSVTLQPTDAFDCNTGLDQTPTDRKLKRENLSMALCLGATKHRPSYEVRNTPSDTAEHALP